MNHYGVTLRLVESSPTSGNVWIYFSESITDGHSKYMVVWDLCLIKYYFEITKLPVRGLGFWKTLPETPGLNFNCKTLKRREMAVLKCNFQFFISRILYVIV